MSNLGRRIKIIRINNESEIEIEIWMYLVSEIDLISIMLRDTIITTIP